MVSAKMYSGADGGTSRAISRANGRGDLYVSKYGNTQSAAVTIDRVIKATITMIALSTSRRSKYTAADAPLTANTRLAGNNGSTASGRRRHAATGTRNAPSASNAKKLAVIQRQDAPSALRCVASELM